jgi:hypothetical protein
LLGWAKRKRARPATCQWKYGGHGANAPLPHPTAAAFPNDDMFKKNLN